LYRVRVGPFKDGKQLQAAQQRLVENGYARGQPLP
jgi:cell division protein FtsN